jgi:hypothetical protein
MPAVAPGPRGSTCRKGKHQDLVGTANEENILVGDAGESITDFARGGNDTLTGGDNSDSSFVVNTLVGDAGDFITDFARGGNDTLIGGNNSGDFLFNALVGDANK